MANRVIICNYQRRVFKGKCLRCRLSAKTNSESIIHVYSTFARLHFESILNAASSKKTTTFPVASEMKPIQCLKRDYTVYRLYLISIDYFQTIPLFTGCIRFLMARTAQSHTKWRHFIYSLGTDINKTLKTPKDLQLMG